MEKLPIDWGYKDINALISTDGIFIDGDWVESKDQDPSGEVRLIQLADIKEFKFVNKSERFLTYQKARALGCTFLKKDDVLVARMPDPLGRACLFPYEENDKYVTVVDVTIIRPGSDAAVPKWLMYFINAPQFRQQMVENAGGSTRLRISRRNLGMLKLPYPPLPEQNRIVAKLDTLFGHLDQLRARLDKIPVLLKQFRQAVLTQAVTGKLTEEWRSRLSSAPFDNFLPCQVTPNNYESKFNIPNWTWATISQVSAMIAGYAFKSNEFVNSGIQVIRMGNLFGDKLDLTRNPVFLPVTQHDDLVKRFSIKSNDILLTLTGTKYKRDYGYAVLVPELKTVVLLNQRILSLRPVINPKFLLYLTRSDIFREQFFSFETGGVNQGNVGTRAVASIVVPVPPMNEQEFMAGRVQSLLAIADRIEKQYELLKDRISRLPEAVLTRAFAAQLFN